MKKFKKMGSNAQIKCLTTYLKDFIDKNPETEIYLSSDSQNRGDRTVHAVVIILYLKGRGGHVLFRKEESPRLLFGKNSGKDYNKLYREASLLEEVATFILENLGRKVDLIALDYNKDEKYFSNRLLLSSIGWLSGIAKKVVGKPNYFSSAADKVVRC